MSFPSLACEQEDMSKAKMQITEWLKQATDFGWTAVAQATQTIGAGYGYVSESVGSLWLFGSTESSDSYDADRYDEKHYFLVPYRLSEIGCSLYSMRCLPSGVPPVNDLPKRRIFHLPNEHAGKAVEELLKQEVRETLETTPADEKAVGSRLISLADQIDKLDDKVFNGVLLIGALVALINPVAGAGIAVKALLPSIGMLLSKFGLKYVGDSFNSWSLEKKIRTAEKDVLKQFRGANTESIANPLLQQLDKALETDAWQFDPMLDVDFEEAEFGQRDRQRMIQLSCRAISNVYEDILADSSTWPQAQLGTEDIRWLELLKTMAETN